MKNWKRNLWANKWWALMFTVLMLLVVLCVAGMVGALVATGAPVAAGALGGVMFVWWCWGTVYIAKLMMVR